MRLGFNPLGMTTVDIDGERARMRAPITGGSDEYGIRE